jgi:hypothetical protein
MIAGLLLAALAAQDTLPTVGDTLWAERRLSVPAGVLVRPRPVRPGGTVEALGAPEVRLVEGEVSLRYPLVAWEPGRHVLTLPGAILVRDDGWSDTLPDWTATLDVASILPAGPRDSLPVQPPAPLVSRNSRSLLPVLLLLGLVAAALVPLHWSWRRRAAPRPPVTRRPAPPAAAVLQTWASRGELHAAVEGWRHRLEAQAGRGGDPMLGQLVDDLRGARYGPRTPEELEALCRRAAERSGEAAP